MNEIEDLKLKVDNLLEFYNKSLDLEEHVRDLMFRVNRLERENNEKPI